MSFKKRLVEVAFDEIGMSNGRVFITMLADIKIALSDNPVIQGKVNVVNDMQVLTLNISPQASKVTFEVEGIAFSGRFDGVVQEDFFGWEKVYSIFCPDNPGLRADFPISTILYEKKEERKRPTFGVIEGGKSGSLH